ncbi:uncharacterized protein [Choristoneura fumiferana]|uniref:uncharacterized protein n=1 Tax=Choristoneura fumiferana TaxID=7141 RepID=UPI003D159915
MANLKEKIIDISKKIAKEQKFGDNYELDVKQLSTDGNSYSSAIFRVTISEKNRDLKLFAKAANINEEFRNSSYAKIFTDEVYFYSELAVKFREIENRHEIEDRDRVLLPKFYGGSTTFREETIVLEDITSRGFIAHDPRLPFGWEYASKVVEQLAKFHALSFVYSLENPAEFTKILEDNPYHIFDTKIMRDVLFDMTVPVALKALEGENRERLKNYLDSKDRFEEMLQLYRQAPKRVIVHGDFKTSNLMHRRQNGQLEVMLVDFQIIHAGTPVTDLLYFIFLGSDEEFRRLHYHDLLEHYYLNLKKSLGLMKVEVDGVYPKTAYEADLKMALPIGLAVALTILPMIQVDSTDAMKIEEDVSPSQTHKPNSLYPARINGVINDYVKWGIL